MNRYFLAASLPSKNALTTSSTLASRDSRALENTSITNHHEDQVWDTASHPPDPS